MELIGFISAPDRCIHRLIVVSEDEIFMYFILPGVQYRLPDIVAQENNLYVGNGIT